MKCKPIKLWVFAVLLSCSRNSDSDYSDGEEDFYYSEIEVNMDSLSEGLSNLTPTSPTTVGPPPAFPPPLTDVPHSENISVNGFQNHAPTLLSQSAPSALCHIRTDHAYQVHTCTQPGHATADNWCCSTDVEVSTMWDRRGRKSSEGSLNYFTPTSVWEQMSGKGKRKKLFWQT